MEGPDSSIWACIITGSKTGQCFRPVLLIVIEGIIDLDASAKSLAVFFIRAPHAQWFGILNPDDLSFAIVDELEIFVCEWTALRTLNLGLISASRSRVSQ